MVDCYLSLSSRLHTVISVSLPHTYVPASILNSDPVFLFFSRIVLALSKLTWFVDIQSHVSLSIEERSRLCGCLNYEKLSLAVCKELAKNPRIPPRIAVQALISQQSRVPKESDYCNNLSTSSTTQMVLYNDAENFLEENEDMRQNLTRMQWRVVELEKECREMKGHMSKLVRHNVLTIPSHNRTLPRLC